MKYCIIDDEPIAHRVIEGYCEQLPYLKKVANAYNAMEASQIIAQNQVDLIFLDINMPKMTGFEWLKTLAKTPSIIVTSAHKEYALEGYELAVIDYLLKPFSFPRFLKAVNKCIEREQTHSIKSEESASEHHSFFIKGDKQYHQVHTDHLLFIEAYGNYTKVYFKEHMILSHEKISTLEKTLPQQKFLRVHKSYLVAVDKIDRIQGNQIYILDRKIPIGLTYRSRINRLLEG